MKKQINPTIKAHLIRGAFYLLLLLAVCAIPFALAQRNATKPTMPSKPGVAPKMNVPVSAGGGSRAGASSQCPYRGSSQFVFGCACECFSSSGGEAANR